jgi:hypothetical protein
MMKQIQAASVHGTQYRYVANGLHFLLHGTESEPALIRPNGYRAFYCEGRRHRMTGPAVIYANGTVKYYQEGLLHRDNGPAVVYPDGARVYAKKGRIHREDGPAVIGHGGACYWFLNGRRLSREKFLEKTATAS